MFSVQEALTGEQALIRFLDLKGLLVIWFASKIEFKAAADHGIGLYVPFLSEPACSSSSIYIDVACSFLDSEPGFSVLSFPL